MGPDIRSAVLSCWLKQITYVAKLIDQQPHFGAYCNMVIFHM